MRANNSHQSVSLGIGDDCALIKPSSNEEIAITSDMLVEGRHFFKDAEPEQLGWKALAVNLSDLAAMGAKPLGFTLSIALPKVDIGWLEGFSKGLFDIAQEFSCPLIGGDTTAGPLTISITAFGSIPHGKAMRRSGARTGDDIWVSGTTGDARLTLAALRHEINVSMDDLRLIEHRMHKPIPRIELGTQLRELASAALDISDGLLGDLHHLLKQSQVSAEIYLDKLPRSITLQKQAIDIQNCFATSGGDDYEICFTAPKAHRAAIEQLSSKLNLPLSIIGEIIPNKERQVTISVFEKPGQLLGEKETAALMKSFDHFLS